MKMFTGIAAIAVALVAVATLSVVAAPADKAQLPVADDQPIVAKKAICTAEEEIRYELFPLSMAVWGCWHPCMCPQFFIGDMMGGFTLIESSRTDELVEYTVEDLAWDVYDLHGEHPYLYTVTGSGTFQVYTPTRGLPTQRLILDLEYDGEEDHFDSGEVLFEGYESLSIWVANHGFRCLNDAFLIQAEPVQIAETISTEEEATLSAKTAEEPTALTTAAGEADAE